MPKQKSPPPPDPDRLVRQQAGTYRTEDERFEVRQTDQGWFLVDAEQTDDFGQELVRGPLPTLAAVRAAIPPARSDKVVPLPRRAVSAGTEAKPRAKPAPRAARPAPPPSWIDRLPARDAAQVRRAIAALEDEGVARAEQLVRRDREGLLPAVATTILQHRLKAMLGKASAQQRELVAQVVALLTHDGAGLPDALSGWMLVEIGPEPVPPNRRIRL